MIVQPVIAFDVAKGVSKAQVFLDRGRPQGKSFDVRHTAEGFTALHQRLQEVETLTGTRPVAIFESTGHYHAMLSYFLETKGYGYVLLNPIVAHQAKGTSLRKVKTDAQDAYRLGELFYKETFELHQPREAATLNFRTLTRQHEAVTRLYVQTKLQFQTVLDQVFPAYRGVFGTLYSQVSLKVLLDFPTADAVLAVPEAALADRIALHGPSRSARWAREKAHALVAAAQCDPFQKARVPSQLFVLTMYVDLLTTYHEHLTALEKQIGALAEMIPACQQVQTIPGIGKKIAATIIAEIGEIDRFSHPKKLAAFAGVDPRVFASGKFTATFNKITKRGSSTLRHALFMAVLCGLRKTGSQRLKAFYDQKRQDGKAHKVAVIACINKLLHWIYAILKRQEAFIDVA